jgi:dihydrodipicolinate synthase/N-acetylneuraminate lyase
MTGGEVRPYLYGRLFGAQAFADLVTCGIAPRAILDFARYADAGDFPRAVEIVRKYEEPLVTAFTPLGIHAAFRAARWLKGKASSYQSRFPLPTLDATGVAAVEKTLRQAGLL